VLKIRAKGGMPVAFADFEVLMLPVKEIACALGLWPSQREKKKKTDSPEISMKTFS
jgi:hypothetical protein